MKPKPARLVASLAALLLTGAGVWAGANVASAAPAAPKSSAVFTMASGPTAGGTCSWGVNSPALP